MIEGGDKMSWVKKDVNLAGFLLKRSENMKNITILKIVNLGRQIYLGHLPLKLHRYARGKADCRFQDKNVIKMSSMKKKR